VTDLYIFHLEENKLKIFRWKLLQYIIPTKKLLMKWRIAINSQCNFCGQDEDYLHYFMYCPYLKEFWVKIQKILKKSNIENFVLDSCDGSLHFPFTINLSF
jgi:hypothetical protein